MLFRLFNTAEIVEVLQLCYSDYSINAEIGEYFQLCYSDCSFTAEISGIFFSHDRP